MAETKETGCLMSETGQAKGGMFRGLPFPPLDQNQPCAASGNLAGLFRDRVRSLRPDRVARGTIADGAGSVSH